MCQGFTKSNSLLLCCICTKQAFFKAYCNPIRNEFLYVPQNLMDLHI